MIKVATFNGTGWPNPAAHEKFKFPAGELQVTVRMRQGDFANIQFEYENNEEIIELLLVVDAVKRAGGKVKTLHMPYVPFARQDRVANEGEAFSLKVFADLINSVGASSVVVSDPHSDVTAALINNVVIIPQEELVKAAFDLNKHLYNHKFYLISPDGGALKKIYKVAKKIPHNVLDIVECSKVRDTMTGEIRETVVHKDNFNEQPCLIVDDICDGGRTFIEIAKILKEKNAGRIVLYVTHGLFTSGFKGFEGLIDEIYSRKGRQR